MLKKEKKKSRQKEEEKKRVVFDKKCFCWVCVHLLMQNDGEMVYFMIWAHVLSLWLSRRCGSRRVPAMFICADAPPPSRCSPKKIHFQLLSPKKIVPKVQRSQIWSAGFAAARWTHGDALLLAERLDDGGSGRLENLPGEPHSAVRRVSAKVFHLFKDVTRRCKRMEIHLGGGAEFTSWFTVPVSAVPPPNLKHSDVWSTREWTKRY